MDQIEKKKAELFEMMEQLAHQPLTSYNIGDLHELMGAYNAMCLVEPWNPIDHEGHENRMTEKEAELWVCHMKNADGSVGAHWTMDKTEQVRTQRGFSCSPINFWVAMNMMYSDYCEVAKKNNASTVDFFADMAKAFLDDADAKPDKLARYHGCVSEC